MNTFESLITQSFQHILTFHGAFLVEHQNGLLKYRIGDNHFIIFVPSGQDGTALFSTSHFRLLDKAELLFFLNPNLTLSELIELLNEINEFTPPDLTPLTASNDLEAIVSYTLAMSKLPTDPDGQWFNTPQFKDRLFYSRGTFKIPLCVYNDRKFIKFTNQITWDDDAVSYLNANTEGFFTTNFLPSNTKLLVCCNPQLWKRQALTSTAADFLFVACHPNSATDFFKELHHLYNKYAFSHIHFFTYLDQCEIIFLLRGVCYFLNYSQADIAFSSEILGSNIQMSLSVNSSNNSVSQINAFLSQIELEVIDNFYDLHKDQIILSTQLLRANKIRVQRVNVATKTTYFVSFRLDLDKINAVLNSLLTYFGKSIRCEVSVYNKG